jgi:peptidoglycan-N-acetylglucosamine deacetylase
MVSSVDVPLLTFDDGPSESTEEILELLREYGLRANFFVIGFRAEQRRGCVERAAEEGHTIGNHTWDHVRLTELPDDDVLVKLRQANQVIEEITGSPPTLFRGPWLAVDDRVLRLAGTLDLTHMGIDVDTCDYSPQHDADYVAQAILRATAGQIVLLHDGTGDERGGPTNPPRPKTVEALQRALPEFAARWSEPA